MPANVFLTNAYAVGHISSVKDSDGILRRVRAYEDYRLTNSLLQAATRIESNRVVFTLQDNREVAIPVDKDGTFSLKDLGAAGLRPLGAAKSLPGFPRLAGRHHSRRDGTGPEREQAEIAPGRITLRGTNGMTRTIPVDAEGSFYVDWSLPVASEQLTKEAIESLLDKDLQRAKGKTVESRFKDKLVVVGSTATGNDLTDFGATPLEKETFLVSVYWNVAHSVMNDRFIQPCSLGVELLLIALMGIGAALLTWHLRALAALLSLAALVVLYHALAVWLFVEYRYWIPLVLPTLTAVFYIYVSLMTYRVIFEQREQRRVKGIFTKIVSPNVVHELLKAEQISLGGARGVVTVFFADVRGFTELTDSNQEQAEEHVRKHNLHGHEAEVYFNEQASEMLATVKMYLSTVANTVKHHNGTLNKYIGDCVMAFWGAPTPNEQHAVSCVRAAMDAQRAIYELNLRRDQENKRRAQENVARAASGQPPLAMLSLLSLGSGINTGMVTVGLMGSDDHILNYTVFGREVNLASRLEGVSGRGRIIIGEATHQELKKFDPELAAKCNPLPAVTVKGFRSAVKIYEVMWKSTPSAAALAAAEKTSLDTGQPTASKPA